jgi:hypothetical protein
VKGKSSSGTTKKDTGDPFLAVTRRKLVAKLRSTGGAEEELDQKIVILVRRQYQLVDVRICLLLEDLLSVCIYTTHELCLLTLLTLLTLLYASAFYLKTC